MAKIKDVILNGNTALGIEFGSTRIKAVLVGEDNTPIASGTYDWEKRLEDHIPQRWSIAHLYQAILNDEDHEKDICYLTTLAGYVHWKLTGKKVLGIGDASGMFPIDIKTQNYDLGMIQIFDELIVDKDYGWELKEILPKVLTAGENAVVLEEIAKMAYQAEHLKKDIKPAPQYLQDKHFFRKHGEHVYYENETIKI